MRELGATQFVCEKPEAMGMTHHLVPVKNVMTCRYCGRTDKEISRS